MALRTIVDTLRGYGILSRYEGVSLLSAATRRRKSEQKCLLLLSPFLPPYDNGGVHRPLAWLQYAQQNGWKTAAITRPFAGTPSTLGRYLQDRMPRDISVSLMQELALQPSWSMFPRTDGTFLGALGAIPTGEQLIEEQRVSVVAATGPSFDLFVSAYYLARMHRLPLVLDYRDEWTENPFKTVQQGNSDRFWESRCLKAAHLVVFTTAAMRDHCLSRFPGLARDKTVVLHNGWEPRDIEDAHPEPVPRKSMPLEPAKEVLHILFAGTIGHATLPGAFLDDVDRLFDCSSEWESRLRIEFIGSRVPEADAQIAGFAHPRNLAVRGKFAKDLANSMIRESDALLLLTPKGMERYIPAKLFEYIASGKPILVHGADGEAAQIVRDVGAGTFVPAGDIARLRQAFELFRVQPASLWKDARRRQWAAEHTRETLAADFFGMLDRLANDHRTYIH